MKQLLFLLTTIILFSCNNGPAYGKGDIVDAFGPILSVLGFLLAAYGAYDFYTGNKLGSRNDQGASRMARGKIFMIVGGIIGFAFWILTATGNA